VSDYGPDLIALAKPFPAKFIKSKGGKYKADYVSHGDVEQKLIAALGHPPNFRLRQVVESDGKLVGVICQMEALIDGRVVAVDEAGDANEGEGPDASPLKNALSDAYKRCAMRLGVALHLWTPEGHYWLYDHIKDSSPPESPPSGDEAGAGEPLTGTPLSRGQGTPPAPATTSGEDSKDALNRDAGSGAQDSPLVADTETDAASQGLSPEPSGDREIALQRALGLYGSHGKLMLAAHQKFGLATIDELDVKQIEALVLEKAGVNA
jgi:hypothetical protein